MRSTDPEFEPKVRLVSRSAELSPGRAERHGFECYRSRDGVAYAALNTQTGEVVGRTAARHTSAEFVRLLQTVVETQPRRCELHIIVDNLSAHKTQRVRSSLVAHPPVQLHYTPTYSSSLNQAELWFSKIERDGTARGIFTSDTDLASIGDALYQALQPDRDAHSLVLRGPLAENREELSGVGR